MSLRSSSLGRSPRPATDGGRLWVGGDDRVVRADAAACRLLGLEAAQVEGRPVTDLLRSHGEAGDDTLLADLDDVWTERPDGTRQPLLVGVGQEDGHLVLFLRDGTARRDARRRLQQSEEQLRRAQHLARIGSWTWDVVHDDIHWSPELFEIYGIDPRGFVPSFENYLALIHPDDRQQVARTVQDALETRRSFTVRHRVVRPDGSLRHVHGQGAVETDARGEPVRMFGIAQDVTEQVEVDRRFEAMLESAPDAMVLVGEDGVIRFINQETERMFGYTREELVGKRAEVLLPEALRDRHVRHRADYHKKPERRPMGAGRELEARRKDGSTFPAEISLSPLEMDDRMLVTAAIRDITERRRVEQVVQDRQARIESLLNHAMDAVVLTDLDGRVVEWNPAAERMFGRPAEDALGLKLQDFVMPPEAQAQFRSILMAAHDHLGREHQVWEAQLLGANGPLPVEAGLARVESGDHTFLLAVMRDVTERRKAEESDRLAFERLIEIQQLREVNRFKTILLNTASHELNTPMTPLRLQLHLLETGRLGPLAPRQRHAVEVLQRNVERLSMLIQDVLDVARLESGRLKMVREPLRVGAVVREAVDTFDQAIAKARLHVEVDVEGDPLVTGDRNRLVQVLVNLVSNAVKFSPPEGHIRVEAEVEDDEVVVRVSDEGPGLEPKQIADLFQPFSQVHDAQQTNVPGTGLGLYISKGIVEQHGGTIGVESEGRGRGATFWFRLPLRHEGPGSA